MSHSWAMLGFPSVQEPRSILCTNFVNDRCTVNERYVNATLSKCTENFLLGARSVDTRHLSQDPNGNKRIVGSLVFLFLFQGSTVLMRFLLARIARALFTFPPTRFPWNAVIQSYVSYVPSSHTKCLLMPLTLYFHASPQTVNAHIKQPFCKRLWPTSRRVLNTELFMGARAPRERVSDATTR